jgi:hypothetical protein
MGQGGLNLSYGGGGGSGEEHEIWKLKYQMEYYRNCITDESRNKMQQVISNLEANRQ